MAIITTFESLDQQIKKAGGKPVVLEALWSGDTNGWYLSCYLYTVTYPFFFRREHHYFLGQVAVPEGTEYFTNSKLTIEGVAEALGNQAAQKYGLTFYFPAKDGPDDECPAWTERHLGILCQDCGKLILPRKSPYIPQEICYPCHLKREWDESLRKAEPADDGYNLCLLKGDECLKMGYCTKFEAFTIAPFIRDKVQQRITKEIVSIVALDIADILVLKGQLETVLDKLLLAYEKPYIEERMKKFIGTYKVQYQGREYELMDRRNQVHADIASYIYNIETAEKAITEGYTYQFFFKQGITSRDDSVLRFVHYVCKGETIIFNIQQRYVHSLTAEEVSATIGKLVQIGCLTVSGERVSITTLGNCIV
ncbi:hypothetical protein FHW36_1047 [Chitinophaga polysaccharea]|uniref:Uncharacterized protein n=1 Tax=Chitinophaga polysaccharea TaxID=1293035 RepID=A0A561PQC1_9BACT|nr:hypothetical protein [Chitinophaga polysaccharea]TWF40325.1 hypothetical protein FHW36_1047 [Chitinophaga polysaccharea]